jgi:diguanylate cyclase (GGDEF)-like protein
LFVSQEQPSPEAGAAARDVIENMLHLEATTWKTVADELLREYLQVAEVFEVQIESEASVIDLYAEAHEEAARVGMVALIERTDVLQANAELLRQATTDPLTGVANRAKFDDRLAEALKGLRRGHGDFAILMFDLDHFKVFNDTHGHEVGDLVLRRVAIAVQNSLREVDLLARYGGEEFVILAPHTDRRGGCIVAARIRKCVEDLRINAHGELVRVTISLGMALSADYDAPFTAEQIIADVDTQLNLSKEAGRNTWSYQGRSASQVAVPTRVG